MKEYILYTDGGSRGNPGIAGAGWVIFSNETTLKKGNQFLGEQTNNWAEYEALFLGLSDLKKIVGQKRTKECLVIVRMDSEFVVKQLNGEYQIKEESLFGQYIKVHNMRVGVFPNIVFTHIPRSENSIADGLANEAMDRGG